MDYIWTYWTKPWKTYRKPYIFDIACIALSTFLAKTHGTAKRIYTDSFGSKLLNKFSIEVDCETTLDILEQENPRKWALPKIYTYSKINFPCVHIDYDVFLWKEQKKSDADFCCQALENFGFYTTLYKTVVEDFKKDSNKFPEEILNYSNNEIYHGYNMGYFQINDYDFLKSYTSKSMEIFSEMKTFDNFNNILPEQYLFYCMTKTYGKKVDTLLEGMKKWEDDCVKNGYTHLMDQKRKEKNAFFLKILNRLKVYNPNSYESILKELNLLNKTGIYANNYKALLKDINTSCNCNGLL